MTTSDSRNAQLRQDVDRIKELGVNYTAIASQMDIFPSNLHKWRSNYYNFGDDKLSKMENIVKRYMKLLG